MRRLTITFFLLLLVLFPCGVHVFHLGVIISEGLPTPEQLPQDLGRTGSLPRENVGINQSIIFGDPCTRGYATGKLTSYLMFQQEATLIREFCRLFPNPLLRNALILGLLRWYWGIQEYFEDWMLEEAYGVSLSASRE